MSFKRTCREFMEHLRTDPRYAFTTQEEMVIFYERKCAHTV